MTWDKEQSFLKPSYQHPRGNDFYAQSPAHEYYDTI
jgi:hypothetical protein